MKPSTTRALPCRRRRTLLGAVGALATGVGRQAFGAVGSAAVEAPVGNGLLACGQATDGRYLLQRVLGDGSAGATLVLPERGHGVALAPFGREAVVVARRPGTFAFVFDRDTLVTRTAIETPATRHFCGHAAYSADGRWLYATENDYAAGAGVIGVYDARTGYARVAEFSSGGVGPHECVLAPDGRTLLVANGGIRTHPDLPRVKLNVDTMQPNLALIDLGRGQLLVRHTLPPDLHKLSIRHLAVAGRGDVVVGLQYEGEVDRVLPLVACLGVSARSLALLPAPDAAWRHLNQYVGSVATDITGSVLVATAPRGDAVACWQMEQNGFHHLGLTGARDVGGACRDVAGRQLWLTGGDGVLRSLHAPRAPLNAGAESLTLSQHTAARFGLAFDNHAVAV